MFCSNCGTQLSEGTRFCHKCGAPQAAASQPQQQPQPQQAPVYAPYPPNPPAQPVTYPAPEAPAPEKKAKNKKLPLIIGLAAGGSGLLIALAVILAIVLSSGSGNLGKNYMYQADCFVSITEYNPVTEDETYYLTNGNSRYLLDTEPDGLGSGYDGSQGFYIDYPDGDADYDEWVPALFYFDSKSVSKVTDHFEYYQQSADGSTVVYVDTTGLNDSQQLHYWKNGNDTIIESFDYVEGFVISPDGSSVVYRGYDDGEPIVCLYRNGSSTPLEHKDAETALVLAVSNDGSLIYYTDEYGDGLRVFDGKNDIRLGKDDDQYYSITDFNIDCTQILYRDNAKTFIWKKGDAEPTQIYDDPLYPIFPAQIQWAHGTTNSGAYIFGVRDFQDIFLENEDRDRCVFLNKKFETNDVIKGYDTLQLAQDGKTLVVLKRGNLYKFDGTKEYRDTSMLIVAEDFVNFNMTPDAKDIYLLDDYNDLYYLQGANKPVKIAEEIGEPDWFYPSVRITLNNRLYFVEDGELCYAEGSRVTTVYGDFKGEPDEIYISGNNVIMYTFDDDDYANYCYHVSPDGTVTLQEVW